MEMARRPIPIVEGKETAYGPIAIIEINEDGLWADSNCCRQWRRPVGRFQLLKSMKTARWPITAIERNKDGQ